MLTLYPLGTLGVANKLLTQRILKTHHQFHGFML